MAAVFFTFVKNCSVQIKIGIVSGKNKKEDKKEKRVKRTYKMEFFAED